MFSVSNSCFTAASHTPASKRSAGTYISHGMLYLGSFHFSFKLGEEEVRLPLGPETREQSLCQRQRGAGGAGESGPLPPQPPLAPSGKERERGQHGVYKPPPEGQHLSGEESSLEPPCCREANAARGAASPARSPPPSLLLLLPRVWGLNTPPDGAGEEQVVFADSDVHLPLLRRGKVPTVTAGESLAPPAPRCGRTPPLPAPQHRAAAQHPLVAAFTWCCPKVKARPLSPPRSLISMVRRKNSLAVPGKPCLC